MVIFHRMHIFTGSSGYFKYIEPGIELMVTMVSKIIWIIYITIRYMSPDQVIGRGQVSSDWWMKESVHPIGRVEIMAGLRVMIMIIMVGSNYEPALLLSIILSYKI